MSKGPEVHRFGEIERGQHSMRDESAPLNSVFPVYTVGPRAKTVGWQGDASLSPHPGWFQAGRERARSWDALISCVIILL